MRPNDSSPTASSPTHPAAGGPYVRLFEDLGLADLALVGGKNASLGEMIRGLGSAGVPVPPGFATTAAAYWDHLDDAGLRATIRQRLDDARATGQPLEAAGAAIRADILGAPVPDAVADAIRGAYDALCVAEGVTDLPVAVRSSATAEDLPEASFAGQQDSFSPLLCVALHGSGDCLP